MTKPLYIFPIVLIFSLIGCGENLSSSNLDKLSVPLVPGTSYTWYASGSCTSDDRTVCVSDADYKTMCLSASGGSKMASSVLTIYNSRASYLLSNGNVDELTVAWKDGYKYGCRLKLEVSGLYRGSSARESVEGGVTTFVFNQEGKLLAHHASPSY
jgi:hypothetical protein